MAAEAGGILMKTAQFLFGQQSGGPHGDIQRARGMAFREHEFVVRSHNVVIERQQNFETRQVPANVTDAAFVVHAQKAKLGAKDALTPHDQACREGWNGTP
jgi:hypothetical protein